MHVGQHEWCMPAASICSLYVGVATKLIDQPDVFIEPHLTLRTCSGELLVAQTGQDFSDVRVLVDVPLDRPLDACAHGASSWHTPEASQR